MFVVTGSEYYAIKDRALIRKQFYVFSSSISLESIMAIKKGGYYRLLPSVYPALHLIYDDRGMERKSCFGILRSVKKPLRVWQLISGKVTLELRLMTMFGAL